MIIDVHVHMGWDYTFDEDFTKRELLEKMEQHHVDVQVVQPGSCHSIERVREQHDTIAGLCKEYPGHFFGMANPSPHLDASVYRDEIRRCIEELGFIAIKLHPMAFGVNPGSESGRKSFEAARTFDVPLMVHTGSGVPFAGPINLLGLSEQYSDVRIIMAHCGQIVFANEAAAVLGRCENVYADTSWSPGFLLREWTRAFGHRMMLGSDHADNTGTEIAKIRTSHFTEEEQTAIFETTALNVFALSGRASSL
jgi:predicted TIM-barrel fold metal-dependent hydrolase